MKNHRLLTLSIASLILASCGGEAQSSSSASSLVSSSSEEAQTSIVESSSEEASSSEDSRGLIRKKVDVDMVSHFGPEFGEDEYTDSCIYDDHWFLEDSRQTNYELAVMSAMVGGASYSNKLDQNGRKIKALLGEMGFTDVKLNTYFDQSIKLEDSMGAVIGRKSIIDDAGKTYTLLAVFPRNAGYGAEWFGNFNMGTSGIHEGFRLARDEILRFMKSYIDENDVSGDLKVWAIGYSRGAATTNLLGGFLAEDHGYLGSDVALDAKDLYVYTIGTPQTITPDTTKKQALSVSASRGEGYFDTVGEAYEYEGQDGTINLDDTIFECIHNFTAVGDYITKLPYGEWGFSRYGRNLSILYGNADMLEDIKRLSPETSAMFSGNKTYSTPLPTKTFSWSSLGLVDGEKTVSSNELVDQRLASLLRIKSERESIVGDGYSSLMGALTAVYGIEGSAFLNKATSQIGSLVKAGLLNYLAYATERIGVSDQEGVAKVLTEILGVFGKSREVASYTDQQFLSDLLDLLINDYQKDIQTALRYQMLCLAIPAPYGTLYYKLLDYAKSHSYAPKTVDALLALLGNFFHDNKTDAGINALLSALVGLVPSEYLTLLPVATGKTYNVDDYPSQEAMNKAVMFDLVESLGIGRFDEGGNQTTTPEVTRYTIASILSLAMSGREKIVNLLFNGMNDGTQTITREASPLTEFVQDVLVLASPKNDGGETVSLKETANKALEDLLELFRADSIARYIDLLKSKPDELRDILTHLLFDPKEKYSFADDLEAAITFIDRLKFLLPAHDHEMYIAYLKSTLPSE